MAGDVATTGTAGADVTSSAPEQQDFPAAPGDNGEATRDTVVPVSAEPASAEPVPAEPAAASLPPPGQLPPSQPPQPAPVEPAPVEPASAEPAPTAVLAASPGPTALTVPATPPPGTIGGAAVRRRLSRLGAPRGGGSQPGAGTPHQDGAGDASQGGHQAHRPRLRGGRPLARRPDAPERRPLHHPPARGGHDPGRTRHEPRHPLRRAAARHRRGHRLHPRRTAHGLRRGRGGAGRRGHQAGPGQVRRGRRGRDRAQDGRRHGPRHPGAGDQARRPAAQHAHAALPAAREAGAQVARGAGDLRAAGAPAGHEHHQVGTRRPGLRHLVPQAVRRDRADGVRACATPGTVPAGRGRRGLHGPARRRSSRRGSPGARSTTTPSTRR